MTACIFLSNQIILTDTGHSSRRQIDALDALIVITSPSHRCIPYFNLCLPLPLGQRHDSLPHSLSFAPAGRHFHLVLPCLHYQPSSLSCISCHRPHQSDGPPPRLFYRSSPPAFSRIYPSSLSSSSSVLMGSCISHVDPESLKLHAEAEEVLKKVGSPPYSARPRVAIFCRIPSPSPRF